MSKRIQKLDNISLTPATIRMLCKRWPSGFKICVKHRAAYSGKEKDCPLCKSDKDYKDGKAIDKIY